MSHHRTVDRTAQQVACDQIVERVHDLTEPRTEVVSQLVRSDDGTRLVARTTNVNHPSLLGQLDAGVTGGTTGIATRAPGSRPAANITAISTLQDIDSQSRHLAASLDARRARRADLRGSLVARLWFLADRAQTLDGDDLRYVATSVTTWWVRARVTTTWGDPPHRLHVPCPECGKVGRLCVVLTPTAASCLECGSAWDGSTIGILGAHVQLMLASVPPELERLTQPERDDVGSPIDPERVPAVLDGLVG